MQQHTVVTSPTVVQPAYVSQQYVAPSVVHTYRDRQTTIIGILLIIAGSFSIVFNIVEIAIIDSFNHTHYDSASGSGFWGGIMYVIAGGFGIAAARSKTRCMINTFLVLAIIGAVLAAIQVLVASLAAGFWDAYLGDPFVRVVYTMEVLLALLGVAAFGLCLWGSILCCATGGCCGPTQPTVVAVPAGQPQVTVVTLQQPNAYQ